MCDLLSVYLDVASCGVAHVVSMMMMVGVVHRSDSVVPWQLHPKKVRLLL